jgi:hypothetical protein
MDLGTGLDRLAELNEVELTNLLQQADIEIERYHLVIRNYSEEKMAKYGTPFMNELMDNRNKIIVELTKKERE